MPSRYVKSLVMFGVALVASMPARAQPLFPHAESIESLAANADLVFIARLVKFGDTERADGREVHNTTIAIEETLKQDLFTGEPYRRLQVAIPRPASVLADWKERSCRLLVAYDEYAPDATAVIELAPGGVEVMTADLTLLRDPEAVIEAAKGALRQMPPALKRIHTFRLRVPRELVPDTQWERYYDTGGHLVLSVPVDQRLEKRARDAIGSEDYQRREEGARALRYFKSDENIARVRTLLADPGFSDWGSDPERPGVEVRYYAVRREAYETLTAWGVDVEKPVVREEVRK